MFKIFQIQNNLLKTEIKRKAFHCSAIIFPLAYIFLDKLYIISILFALTLIVLFLDIKRHHNNNISITVDKFFASIIRSNEINGTFNLSGVSFMFLGFLLTAIVFNKGLVITSWLILIISDTIAAIAGIQFGSSNNKSMAGSSAFLISSILIGIFCSIFIGYHTNFITIIISSLFTTIAEYKSKSLINDNLLIPLTYASINSIFMYFFI